jgi:hypothetical protein
MSGMFRKLCVNYKTTLQGPVQRLPCPISIVFPRKVLAISGPHSFLLLINFRVRGPRVDENKNTTFR